MELADPIVLCALLGLPLLALLRWRQTCRSAIRFAPLQYHRGSQRRAVLLRLGLVLELLLLATVVVALAGPQQVDIVESVTSEGLDVAMVLDISASMQAADLSPNRLEALKTVATEFLYRGGGNRVGVFAFAGHTFTQTPLTTDHMILEELIGSLAYESINHAESGGTAIGDAMLVAADALVSSGVTGRDQVILLISDGESNVGIDPELSARHLREQGIRLHVIGIGGDEPVEVMVHGKPFINADDEVLVTSLDDSQLIRIAETAAGRYYRARNRDVLVEIFEQLALLESTPIEVQRLRLQRSLVPRLALLVLGLFLSWLWLNAAVLRRPLR